MIRENNQIISVEASAGSGKTYSLAKRYIHLLLSDNNDEIPNTLKNIIAVTFANKAAVEMKYRVIDYLKKIALLQDCNNILDGLNISKKEAARRSLIVLDEILKNYDSFNISTIDSFLNHILKTCAINIDISPNFKIEKDSSPHLLYAVDSFLRNAADNKTLQLLLNEYVEQYILSEKSGWFPKNDIYNEVEKVLIKSGYTGKEISSEVKNFNIGLKERVKNIKNNLEFFLENFFNLDIYAQHIKDIEKMLSKSELFYKADFPKSFSNKNLKYKKDASPNKKADELWSLIHKQIKEYVEFYARNYYSIYSEIYLKINLLFEKQAHKDEVVFLSEINKKSMQFFSGDNIMMPEVYYRLSEKYKHFLIDEFQDTSFVQWAGLKRFLEESLSTGGSFFYVGDIKQAIYGFRGGKPEIFESALNEFKGIKTKREILKDNHRSQKSIVDFNNKVFSRENIEKYLKSVTEEEMPEVYNTLLDAYSFSNQIPRPKKNKGYVKIETVNVENVEDYEKVKAKFLSFIDEIKIRFSFKDIAVLCRTNEDVLEVSSWLLDNKIDVDSAQTLNLRNNHIIILLVALLRFINSPIDTLSFTAFITGKVFNKESGLKSEEMQSLLFIHNIGHSKEAFYRVFREKYKEIWEKYFEEFFTKAGFVPVYELVISILEKFKIIQNFPDVKIFVIRFLELIKEFEKDKSGIKNFLEYFDSLKESDEILYVKSFSSAGVKVMTQHKAKGLQFPVVIIPFLELSDKRTDSLYFNESGKKLELLKVSKPMTLFSENIKKLYNKKKADDLLAEINTLYVSLTRAEYEMYGIITKKSRDTNKVSKFLGFDEIEMGKQEIYKLNKPDFRIVNDEVGLNYKSFDYGVTKSISDIDLDDVKIKGSMIHYGLSIIKTLKNKNMKAEIDKAVFEVKRKFTYEDAGWLKEVLKSFVSNKEIFEIFNHDEENVFNEKEIVNSKGETLRADKVVIENNNVFIYDFKTTLSSKIDMVQLEKYISCFNQIYKDCKVQGYFVDIKNKKIAKVKDEF